MSTGSAQASAPLSMASVGCLEAQTRCAADTSCKAAYQILTHCASLELGSSLAAEVPRECLEAQGSLSQHSSLLSCKCRRGSRSEELCLMVYWTVRFSQGFEEYDSSPYEDLEMELVRSIEMSRMSSIVAASSLPPNGQNQCLKAAQDCGLYEKCGSLRSEYVLACTKRVPGSERCNRQKCHRALRRFLERVPEQYSFGVLFCPCTDTLCGERRRKTIVPSCSFEDRDGKPNCLSLQAHCIRDELCRSRLADFQHNCQASPYSLSGCLQDSSAVCLKAYAGLIGTIMTPNYVSNSSMEVSQWCSCEGSGNQWQDCLRILHMFSDNGCLRNAISALGSWPSRSVETTPLPRPRPSPRIRHDEINGNVLPELNVVEKSEEEEEEVVEESHEEVEREFNVIQLYSEKGTESNMHSGAWGWAGSPGPSLLLSLLLLLTDTLN
uniref:GDNF family receptor alpha-4-like n=1 Tax=Paramormyrops kingsleyae TaxID=1676925 RepID=A0A3B3QA83_9TELE